MKRREFTKRALALGGASLAGAFTSAAQEGVASGPNLPLQPMQFGKALKIDLRSPGVKWRNGEVHVLQFHEIAFELHEGEGRVTAVLKGGLWTFDNVVYEISGAIMDGAAGLLGTGKTQCKVQRLWLGRMMMTQKELTMDFGLSLDYWKAKSFALSINKRPVQTPDEWMKGEGEEE